MTATFDDYRRDLCKECSDLTLDRFRQSPVLAGVQSAQVQQSQELFDAAIDSLIQRTLDAAIGAQLDVLGRIVGLFPRPLENAGVIVWFAPDNPLAAPDLAPVWVTGGPLTGFLPVGDVTYRTLIRAKIFRNHVKYGSAPEIAYYGRLAYNTDISVRGIGNADVELFFHGPVSPQTVDLVLQDNNDLTADHKFGLPLPTTARITNVVFAPQNYFRPDSEFGPDVAPVGVSYGINP